MNAVPWSNIGSWITNRLNVDDRKPEIVLKIPYTDASIGIAGMEPTFWIALVIVAFFQVLLAATAAVIAYYWIIRKRGTMTAYLLGYGILIPALLYIPFVIADMIPSMRNSFVLFALFGYPPVTCFRLMASMHGTTVASTEKELVSTVLYYIELVPFQRDKDNELPSLITRQELIKNSINSLQYFMHVAILLNLMEFCDYKPFPSVEPIQSIWDIFYWGNLLNNYFMAATISVLISLNGSILSVLFSLLTGFRIMSLHDSPLTASTSVTNFWSKRWNRVMSVPFRIGVFKPLLKNGYSKSIAILASFVASGVFHEYLFSALAFRYGIDHNNPHHQAVFLNQMLFFGWNGVLMFIERIIGDHPLFVWIGGNVPGPIRTFFIVMLALPLGHLIANEFIDQGLFPGVMFGLPKLFWLPG